MSVIQNLRRAIHVLATPPAELPDAYEAFIWAHSENPLEWVPTVRAEYQGYAEAFAFLAEADAHRTAQPATSACTCSTVHHALTVLERATVVTARQVAMDQGKTDRVLYLGQQLGDCPTSGRPAVERRPVPRPARINRKAWHFGGQR